MDREVLSDTKSRRQYDSMRPFDDDIPERFNKLVNDFFKSRALATRSLTNEMFSRLVIAKLSSLSSDVYSSGSNLLPACKGLRGVANGQERYANP